MQPYALSGRAQLRAPTAARCGRRVAARALTGSSRRRASLITRLHPVPQPGYLPRVASVEAPVTTSPTSSPPAKGGQQYNWYASWYPVAALTSLKADAPNGLKLLDLHLCAWKDAAGAWTVFEDLCPHRLAPLSEGRIHESGELQCTYHGWRWQADGSCTSIPQIPDPAAHATACGSKRSCVKAYPVQERSGVLWVWPDASPAGWAAAKALPVPTSAVPELESQGWEIKSPWFQRDIPLSLDVLYENFLDPSHVAHSHHGVIGDRDANHHMTISKLEDISLRGFAYHVQSKTRDMAYRLEFLPPALVKHNFPGAPMLLYGIPTGKGWSRIIMTFIGPPGSTQARPPTPQLPGWLNFMLDQIDKVPALQHALNRNAIIDGDSYFLHVAERRMYERGDSASWPRQYFMPGSADAAVLAWRKWIDTHGQAAPWLPRSAEDLPPEMSREQVFDRLGQHTAACPHCSAALRNATIAAGLAAAAAAIALGAAVGAVVTGAAPLLSGFTARAVGAAALAGALLAGLLRLRRLFVYEDYVHAHK